MSDEKKWTPEPWYVDPLDKGIRSSVDDYKRGGIRIEFVMRPECGEPEWRAANAERAVACVNACAGMESPAAEIEQLRNENERWGEIIKDELAETLKLMEALGVEKEVESGTACMEAMLTKITQLRTDLRTLAAEVKLGRRARQLAIKAETELCDPSGMAASAAAMYRCAQDATDASGALDRAGRGG